MRTASEIRSLNHPEPRVPRYAGIEEYIASRGEMPVIDVSSWVCTCKNNRIVPVVSCCGWDHLRTGCRLVTLDGLMCSRFDMAQL